MPTSMSERPSASGSETGFAFDGAGQRGQERRAQPDRRTPLPERHFVAVRRAIPSPRAPSSHFGKPNTATSRPSRDSNAEGREVSCEREIAGPSTQERSSCSIRHDPLRTR